MYMWQAGRIDRGILTLFFAGVVSIGAFAQNQTVKINIQLPPGVGLSARSGASSTGSAGSGSSSAADNGTNRIAESVVNYAVMSEDGTLIPLSWIKMQALENSQFLIDFQKSDGSRMKTTFYYLNTGTDFLQDAAPVTSFPAVMQFNYEGRLIRNFVPRRTSVYSWIGIPNDPALRAVIEYF
jgi:hypothetical protein